MPHNLFAEMCAHRLPAFHRHTQPHSLCTATTCIHRHTQPQPVQSSTCLPQIHTATQSLHNDHQSLTKAHSHTVYAELPPAFHRHTQPHSLCSATTSLSQTHTATQSVQLPPAFYRHTQPQDLCTVNTLSSTYTHKNAVQSDQLLSTDTHRHAQPHSQCTVNTCLPPDTHRHTVCAQRPPASVIQTSQLMLYREIVAVFSEIHTKHINTAVWAERGVVEG